MRATPPSGARQCCTPVRPMGACSTLPGKARSWRANARSGTSPEAGYGCARRQAQPALWEVDAVKAAIRDPRSAFEQYHAMLLAKQMLDDLSVEQRQGLAEVLKDERSMRFPFDRGRRRLSQAILDSSETYP